MRRVAIVLGGIVTAGTLAATESSARAATVFYEPFNYTVGANLKDQAGWTEPGGAEDSVLDKIAAGSLTFGGLSTSGNSVRTGGQYSVDAFVGANDGDPGTFIGPNGSTFWFSFLLKRETNVSGIADYGGLILGSSANDANNLFVGKTGTSNNYGVEALDGSAQQLSGVAVGTSTAFLVVKITFSAAAETISLYVNPTPGIAEGSLPAPVTTAIELFAFNDFAISTGVNAQWLVDEFRIGTTFADVSPVPEPGGCILAGASFLMLLGRRARRR